MCESAYCCNKTEFHHLILDIFLAKATKLGETLLLNESHKNKLVFLFFVVTVQPHFKQLPQAFHGTMEKIYQPLFPF